MNQVFSSENIDWDERNQVKIVHVKSIHEFDHSTTEALEYVVDGDSGDHLDLVALYKPKPSKTLIVSFHGSLVRSKFQLPRFEWRRTLTELDAGLLLIADSTLTLSDTMPLGWYIGTAEHDLSSEIAATIQQVAAEGDYRNVVLTGSSGGGFAAMAVSHRIPGSVAVSFSPQTRVADYIPWVSRSFVRSAFSNYQTIEDVEADFPDRVNLRSLYSDPSVKNYVRYVQNKNDLDHVEKHFSPFSLVRGVDPLTGGIDSTGRVRLVLESMSKGHEPPSRGRFLRNLEEAHLEFFGEPLHRVTTEI